MRPFNFGRMNEFTSEVPRCEVTRIFLQEKNRLLFQKLGIKEITGSNQHCFSASTFAIIFKQF